MRSPAKVQEALEQLGYDKSKHSVSILECDFADLQQVKGFAEQALEKLGNDKLDELLLNHAIIKPTSETPGPRGSKWDEAYIVNHLCESWAQAEAHLRPRHGLTHPAHHYLVHLLRPAIERSGTRIVYVSSEVFAGVTDASALRPKQLAGAGTHFYDLYCTTKLSQLLGALWWSRTFGDKASIVAVSPGMVNGTGLGRHFLQPGEAPKERPGANDLAAGTKLILAGFTRDDLLKDPSSIFLTVSALGTVIGESALTPRAGPGRMVELAREVPCRRRAQGARRICAIEGGD